MSSRRAYWLAWSSCALVLALIVCGFILSFLSRGVAGEPSSFPFVGVASAVVGGLVASRRPGNPVGWLFLGSAAAGSIREAAGVYAVYGIAVEPGTLPLAWTMAWVSNLLETVGPMMIFVFLPLYFPDGRLISPRWRLVVGFALGVTVAGTLLIAISPGEAVYGSGIENPLGMESLQSALAVTNSVFFALYMGLIFVAAASLVIRYRRSSAAERLQLKWFAFVAVLIPVWFLTNWPVESFSPALFAVLDSLVVAGLPVAVGIAVLRYRLYDIDRIINRALVYGVLTAALVLTYLGSVVLLQGVFRAITDSESQLAIVASTLAIAALFVPLRRLIQNVIDRRFYRTKYDAAKTLEAFSARLRDEVELRSIAGGLTKAVETTLQPEHVSLWLPERGEVEAQGKDFTGF